MAELSRLELTDDELTQATQNLEGIFGHFSAIQNLDTTNVPTSDDASGLVNVSREDQTKSEELGTHGALLAQAPQVKKGQIQVKAVFNN